MTLQNRFGLMVVAAIAGVLEITFLVAGLAFVLAKAPMIERESMPAQAGRRPGVFGMAVLALHPEETGVDFRFKMALDTGSRGAGEYVVLVAACAVDEGVLPFQWEIGRLVIKVHHAINAIMANQAIVPEIACVLQHEV